MTHSKEDMRKFVIDCRAEEGRQRTFSSMERLLWDLAELAPYGTRVITTNEKVLADPYLMRVYLTADREELERLLASLGLPSLLARQLRYMPRPYLHYFFRGDDDRAYHNHPWRRSFSFILVGGYVEHSWDFAKKESSSRLFLPGQVNHLKRGTYHRVELLPGKKCWTCFVSTGRVQASDGFDWEFYDPDTNVFTPWGQWTAEEHGTKRASAPPAPGVDMASGPSWSAERRHQGVADRDDDPNAGHGGYDWSSLRR